MIEPIIKVENMEVTYNAGESNEYKALKDINLEIFPQEYIILFGPSGCGKSTLLYSILGVLPPTKGRMIIKGEDIYKYLTEELVRFQQYTIGIIYQSFNLIPSLSVLDNVSLPPIFAGVSLAKREERALMLLKRFDVDHIAHKLPMMLSGGQQQRVAVSRSLINNPEILLADEAVGNLDSISAEQVMRTLEEINLKDKKTVILVTHDAKYLPYAHRVYYLKDGVIERVVVNPEKPQIKKTDPKEKSIITEIEKFARIYPYASPEELKVKSIVNYLTQDLDFDQVDALEKIVKCVIEGKLDSKNFLNILVSDLSRGGVGVPKLTAVEMSEKMNKIMKESKDVYRYRKKIGVEESVYEQQKFIRRLREHLLEECGEKLTSEQIKILEETISDRVSGIIKKDDFQKRLDFPLKDGGVGFDSRMARKLTRYMEKLLAQGIPL